MSIHRLIALEQNSVFFFLWCVATKEQCTPTTADNKAGGSRLKRKCYTRKQKRGKHSSASARLKANPFRPALPSILLSNVRSLDSKMDYPWLQHSTRLELRTVVFILTEKWLNADIADLAIQLTGLACYRADREASLSGKSRDSGLCIYIDCGARIWMK